MNGVLDPRTYDIVLRYVRMIESRSDELRSKCYGYVQKLVEELCRCRGEMCERVCADELYKRYYHCDSTIDYVLCAWRCRYANNCADFKQCLRDCGVVPDHTSYYGLRYYERITPQLADGIRTVINAFNRICYGLL